MNIICTICSDLLNQAENLHATACGHLFHDECLSRWIDRSPTCPQCRARVISGGINRLYPTIANEVSSEDAARLQSKLDNAQLQLREQAAAGKAKEQSLNAALAAVKQKEEVLKATEKRLVTQNSAVAAMKEQLQYLKIQNRETQKLRTENEELKQSLLNLTRLKKIFDDTCSDVEQMLEGYPDARTIATFATALKKALCDSETKNKDFRYRLGEVKQELAKEKMMCNDWQTKYTEVKEKLEAAAKQNEALKYHKRRAGFVDLTCDDEMVNPKRLCEEGDLGSGAVANGHDDSINTMVKKIENADSPYLVLKHSSLALAALQRPSRSGDGNLTHTEPGSLLQERRDGDAGHEAHAGHAGAAGQPPSSASDEPREFVKGYTVIADINDTHIFCVVAAGDGVIVNVDRLNRRSGSVPPDGIPVAVDGGAPADGGGEAGPTPASASLEMETAEDNDGEEVRGEAGEEVGREVGGEVEEVGREVGEEVGEEVGDEVGREVGDEVGGGSEPSPGKPRPPAARPLRRGERLRQSPHRFGFIRA